MGLRRLPQIPATAGALWSGETKALIDRGAVLPVVSNFLLPTIFSEKDPYEVAKGWAAEIASPLSDADNCQIARVAQFYTVKANSVRKARVEYHNVLKGFLLTKAREAPSAAVDPDYVEDLIGNPDRLQMATFSEIARALAVPRFENLDRNPMRMLAELPLKIYLTTSHHMFLEAELVRTDHKAPVTEIFYWDEAQQSIPSIFETEPDYRPSVDRPLVYHLFGVDKYPESMVLSDDDYLSIFMRLSELKREVKLSDTGRGAAPGAKFDIPSDLKTALSGSGLLLLGYDIDDWDFRVLFRWLVRYVGPSRDGRSAPEAFCMQLPADGKRGPERNRQIQDYLTAFFERNSFSVYWGDPEACVRDLWTTWRRS